MNDRKLLVLVVETELPLAALYQLDLTQQGHRVAVVHSAEHALEVLTPQYDLVVTDLRLGEMSGEALITSIRTHPNYADLPVLVITADPHPPEAIRDPATTIIRKPFELERLSEIVVQAAGRGRFRN